MWLVQTVLAGIGLAVVLIGVVILVCPWFVKWQ